MKDGGTKDDRYGIAGPWAAGCVVKAFNGQLVSCISVYMRPSMGPVGLNATSLSKVGEMVAMLGHPAVVGGDFNMEPRTIAESRWVRAMQAVVRGPARPTVVTTDDGGKVRDFFIVSTSIARDAQWSG